MTKLTLGYSTCPNDTFIFDAIANKKIDLEGLEFDIVMEDVEQLNKRALQQQLDITKLSYHAYMYVINNYILLRSGSALGRSCGPLLIARQEIPKARIKDLTIAIPGEMTTANLLLKLAFPEIARTQAMLFSDIEDAILANQVDAGLIIHENRFTYEAKGLVKIIDLGEYWERRMELPIPLGGIVARRNFDTVLLTTLNRVLRRSVEHALQNPQGTMNYVQQHAQTMTPAVVEQHIGLYVNKFSVDLGTEGTLAIQTLYDTAQRLALIPVTELPYLIEERRTNPA